MRRNFGWKQLPINFISKTFRFCLRRWKLKSEIACSGMDRPEVFQHLLLSFFLCLCFLVYNRYTSCSTPYALCTPPPTRTPTGTVGSVLSTLTWSPIKLNLYFFSPSNYCFQGLGILIKARGFSTNTGQVFENIRQGGRPREKTIILIAFSKECNGSFT